MSAIAAGWVLAALAVLIFAAIIDRDGPRGA